ncbi:MAG: hypothetical protein ACM3IH_16170, partial [Sphingobacteriales bacterium]
AGRTVLRLDSMAAPPSRALGILSEELPWLRATRLPHNPLQPPVTIHITATESLTKKACNGLLQQNRPKADIMVATKVRNDPKRTQGRFEDFGLILTTGNTRR